MKSIFNSVAWGVAAVITVAGLGLAVGASTPTIAIAGTIAAASIAFQYQP